MEVAREVPGDYGLPLIGTIKDRLDFFYFQGEVEYFRSRAKKHKSKVIKVNFVPGPPGFPNPRGIALLDHRCFPILFDNSKVEKKDVFVGPFKPSDAYTGGFRTLAYMDTAEDRHSLLKEYVFEILRSNGRRFLPEFESAFNSAFEDLDSEKVDGSSSEEFVAALEKLAFDFMIKSVVDADPSGELGSDGVSLIKSWIGFQFAPIAPVGSVGLPSFLEDLILRNFPLPFLAVQKQYEKLAGFFRRNASEMLNLAETKFNLDREEALHNLIFFVGINGWLGFSKLLPSCAHYIGSMNRQQQLQLGEEIRSAMKSSAGNFMAAVDKMELLKSTALEVLRMSPPVLYQYGRARRDFAVESCDGKFLIKKGELLGGSQAIVCRDPEVFRDPDEFVPDRFVGRNRELGAFVFWSNGRNTDSPTIHNKQCGGKDFVEMIARFFIAQLFLRYESMEAGQDSTPLKPTLINRAKLCVRVC